MRNHGDTLTVTAQCDSLQRLCERYEAELTRRSDSHNDSSNDVQTTSERRTNNLGNLIIAFIAGLATGAILTRLIKRLWKIKVY